MPGIATAGAADARSLTLRIPTMKLPATPALKAASIASTFVDSGLARDLRAAGSMMLNRNGKACQARASVRQHRFVKGIHCADAPLLC